MIANTRFRGHRHRSVPRWILAAVIAVGGVLITAYRAPAGGADWRSYQGPLYPLEDPGISEQDDLLIFQADGLLLQECMNDAGYEYVIVEPSPDPVGSRYGERVPPDTRYEPPIDPNIAILQSLPAGEQSNWETALFGLESTRVRFATAVGLVSKPGNGCIHDAETALFGDPVEKAKVVAEIDALRWQASRSAETHEDVIAAIRAWRDCLSDRGLTPSDDPRESHWAKAGEGALADSLCRDQSELNQIWEKVESFYQAQLLDANKDFFDRWHERNRRALAIAKQVIAALD